MAGAVDSDELIEVRGEGCKLLAMSKGHDAVVGAVDDEDRRGNMRDLGRVLEDVKARDGKGQLCLDGRGERRCEE